MKLLVLITPIMLFSSCVSSLLKEKVAKLSDDISIIEPAKPFKEQSQRSHRAWKSTESQNIILITSDCEDANYSLNSIHQYLTDNLTNTNISPETPAQYNRIKGYERFTTGYLDDNAIEIRTFAFKNKNCLYLAALSGKSGNTQRDREQWVHFLNNIGFNR